LPMVQRSGRSQIFVSTALSAQSDFQPSMWKVRVQRLPIRASML